MKRTEMKEDVARRKTMRGRVECLARNGVPCPRCPGFFAGTSPESLEKALIEGKIVPKQIQCGVMEEQARNFLRLRFSGGGGYGK